MILSITKTAGEEKSNPKRSLQRYLGQPIQNKVWIFLIISRACRPLGTFALGCDWFVVSAAARWLARKIPIPITQTLSPRYAFIQSWSWSGFLTWFAQSFEKVEFQSEKEKKIKKKTNGKIQDRPGSTFTEKVKNNISNARVGWCDSKGLLLNEDSSLNERKKCHDEL